MPHRGDRCSSVDRCVSITIVGADDTHGRERPDTPAADAEAVSGLPWGPTLRKVEISDAELDRLRRQVGWIAGRLAATEDVDETFAVDAVTLHVGLTASGSFVWASAGVNVAVEVMWRRKPNG
jgi:hypothetical protein